ncbi:MAG: hypothetical protein MRY83_22055, partial [Flavobacteriales bacterium]|nr:hypothetical protein [Flavobacteriales bacterium]
IHTGFHLIDNNRLWAYTKNGTNILLDTLGREISPLRFDNTFSFRNTMQLASVDGLYGIINSKTMKWAVPPEFACLRSLSENVFRAVSTANKVGIIHSSGKYIIPLLYDSIIRVYADRNTEDKILQWWLAYSGKDKILYSNKYQKIAEKNKVEEMLLDFALNDTEDLALNVVGYSISHSFNSENPKVTLKNSPFRKFLFHTLREIGSSAQFNPWPELTLFVSPKTQVEQCSKLTNIEHKSKFDIYYLDEHIAGVYGSFENHVNFYYPSQNHSSYFHFINRNGSIKRLEILDIFSSKEILEKELAKAIEDKVFVEESCHQTQISADWVDHFNVSSLGIELILNVKLRDANNSIDEPFIHYYQPTTRVLIPWENFAQYDATKWLAELYM